MSDTLHEQIQSINEEMQALDLTLREQIHDLEVLIYGLQTAVLQLQTLKRDELLSQTIDAAPVPQSLRA